MLSTYVVEFEMPVWRIIPFTDQPWLALELRDSDRLQAKFAAVNVPENALALAPNAGPEPWWVGLQGAAHGNLYVHQFHRQPQVGVSGLAAISTSSGQVAWERIGFCFQGIEETSILVEEVNSPQTPAHTINPATGFSEAEWQTHAGRITVQIQQDQPQPLFPVTYLPDNPHYATLSGFLQLKLQVAVEGPMEYLETERHIIFSIHFRQEEVLVNYLVIFANNGHLRFRKCLASDLSGFAADTFLFFCGKVVCLQGRKSLLLIDLED